MLKMRTVCASNVEASLENACRFLNRWGITMPNHNAVLVILSYPFVRSRILSFSIVSTQVEGIWLKSCAQS